MTRLTIRPLLAACLLASAGMALAAGDGGTATGQAWLGFTPEGTAAQRSLEQRFDALLDPADQREWLRQMSSQPNQVGSPHDKANAEFMLAKFKEWGWDARIETFNVLYPTPRKVALELKGPQPFTARLREPAVKGDATSGITADALPPYNVYGGDGDVTAPLVYVNDGMPDDYKELARRGIDVRGKIVITRYGGGWRGLKPKLAQEHGAAGCLIYSDPADDGYATGDSYPAGGARPANGIQRGSVEDMTTYPGDPLTPGIGATADAKRLTRAQSKVILKIPALPISYADAAKIIAALKGPVVTGKQRGALGMAYHWGGTGAVTVHLAVKSDWSLKPVYDVIAMMKGDAELLARLKPYKPGDFTVSAIVAHELYFGAYKGHRIAENLARLEALRIPLLEFDPEDARHAGEPQPASEPRS